MNDRKIRAIFANEEKLLLDVRAMGCSFADREEGVEINVPHDVPISQIILAAYNAGATVKFNDEDLSVCKKHGIKMLWGWQGEECEKCDREFQEMQGCRCGGTVCCPKCILAGHLVDKTRKCEPDCDTLCPVCCPDS